MILRILVLVLGASFFCGAVEARRTHYYTCRLDRSDQLGRFTAEAELSEGGNLRWRSLDWSSSDDLRPLVIGTSWWPTRNGDVSNSQALASFSYFYGRRGQRLRFELRAADGRVLQASPLIRRRDMSFHYQLPWAGLRASLQAEGTAQLLGIDADGTVLAQHPIAAEQLDAVEAEAHRLNADLSTMISNFRNDCHSTRDEITVF
jgi:hypothetical protein